MIFMENAESLDIASKLYCIYTYELDKINNFHFF